MEIYLKINEIREKIVDILIRKYCNTYRNTFENIAIYRDTKIHPIRSPIYYTVISLRKSNILISLKFEVGHGPMIFDRVGPLELNSNNSSPPVSGSLQCTNQ